MYTYQMIGIADDNGRTYKSKYGYYNKKNGFILSDPTFKEDIKDLLYKLFHEDCWSLKNPKKMTKEEIEAVLGYEIDIIDNKKKEHLETNANTIFSDMFSFLSD